MRAAHDDPTLALPPADLPGLLTHVAHRLGLQGDAAEAMAAWVWQRLGDEDAPLLARWRGEQPFRTYLTGVVEQLGRRWIAMRPTGAPGATPAPPARRWADGFATV